MSNKKNKVSRIVLAILSCVTPVPFGVNANENVQKNGIHDAVLMKQPGLIAQRQQSLMVPGSNQNIALKTLNNKNIKSKSNPKFDRKLASNVVFIGTAFAGLSFCLGARFGIFGKKYTIDDLKNVYKQLYDKELEKYKLDVVGESSAQLNDEIEKLKEAKENIAKNLKGQNDAHINEEIDKLEHPSDDEEHKKKDEHLIAWVISRIQKRKIEVMYDAQRGHTIKGLNGVTPERKTLGQYTCEKHLVTVNDNERYLLFVHDNSDILACYKADGGNKLGPLVYCNSKFDEEKFKNERNKENDKKIVIDFFNDIYKEYLGKEKFNNIIASFSLRERKEYNFPMLSLKKLFGLAIDRNVNVKLEKDVYFLNQGNEQWGMPSIDTNYSTKITISHGQYEKSWYLNYAKNPESPLNLDLDECIYVNNMTIGEYE